jgi:arylsulfatase A-like enzyme
MGRDGMCRRTFTRLAAAGSLIGARAQGRPNILWMIAEDLSTDLACYGNSSVRTPEIDRLGAEGVRFTRAYTTGSICSPSRSAIATGMYQTSIDAHNHRSHRDDGYSLPRGVHVFTHYLRQSGYHTSLLAPGTRGLSANRKTDFNFNAPPAFDSADWTGRKSGQPFYAQLNFPQTHRPFQRFPERPIDPRSVVLPASFPDHPVVRQDFAMYLETMQHLDRNVGRALDLLRSDGLLENTIVFFFGDNGRPLPRGKGFGYESGIHVPLVVRFPEQFRPADAPRGSVRDDLVSSLDITVTTLRLAGVEPPQHMAGLPLFGSGSRSRKHIVAAVDRCDEAVDRVRCVVGSRYKYMRNFYPELPYAQPSVYRDTEYPSLRVMRELHALGKLTREQAQYTASRRPPEELYDLQEDPHELRNLALSQPESSVVRQMRGTLDRWIRDTGDRGAQPEERLPKEYDYRLGKVDEWCTRDCKLSRTPSGMRVSLDGKPAKVMRGVVTEGGDMEMRFRARSTSAGPSTISWGTVTEFADPKNVAPVRFLAGGEWREYSVPLSAPGTLAIVSLHFEKPAGVCDFEWIRLLRRRNGKAEIAAEWNFAAAHRVGGA